MNTAKINRRIIANGSKFYIYQLDAVSDEFKDEVLTREETSNGNYSPLTINDDGVIEFATSFNVGATATLEMGYNGKPRLANADIEALTDEIRDIDKRMDLNPTNLNLVKARTRLSRVVKALKDEAEAICQKEYEAYKASSPVDEAPKAKSKAKASTARKRSSKDVSDEL